ncbi:MAG: 8-amino-7-oxononanoate synthase, partial [Thermotogae bacterium]
MFDYSQLTKELKDLKAQGLYIHIRTLEGPQGAWLEIEGKRVLNLCSNNYLGFANEPRLKKTAIEAIEKWGVGPGAVRTIAGTLKIHEELEEALAKFKRVEAALFFQTGFITNQAVIPTLVEEGDAVFSDELNHASIIDGIRLTKAKRYIFKHRDVEDLKAKLEEASGENFRRRLIVTDGVFSMDGDLAPLPEIVELAEKYNA